MGACDIVYNRETGQIFTRTPESWAKIGLFYFVYYSCLAAFFAGLLSVFLFAFTDDTAPLLTGSHSVLPPNPGMGFRPMPKEDKTIIKYQVSKKDTYEPYITNLREFLNPNETANTYMKGQSELSYQDCSAGGPVAPSWTDKPCKFLVPELKGVMDNCVNANYGYEDGTPCFVIKLNKIFEFMPKLEVNATEDFLKFECSGEHPADKDNAGLFEYYPKQGVDLAFYPFVGQKGYLSPLVFVKMQNPAKGVLIQIECKPVNAENIKQNKMSNGAGRVTLEVLIDN